MSKTRPPRKLFVRLETLRTLDVHQLLDINGGGLWSTIAAAAAKANETTIVCPSAGGHCPSALANCPSVGRGC